MKLLKSSLFFSATLAAALTAANSSYGQEVLVNGSFESGLADWNPESGAVISTAYHSDGTQSCILWGNDRTNSTISQDIDLLTNAVYNLQFSFAAKGDSTNTAALKVLVYSDDGVMVSSNFIAKTCNPSPSFTSYGYTFIYTGDCTPAYIQLENATTKDVDVGVIVDNISLIEPNYMQNSGFDGSNDWSFSGDTELTDGGCGLALDDNTTGEVSQNVSLSNSYHLLTFDFTADGNQYNIGDYSYVFVQIYSNSDILCSFTATNRSTGTTNWVAQQFGFIAYGGTYTVHLGTYNRTYEPDEAVGAIIDNVRID